MEARFDLANCNEKQRRFVLSLGELLCKDHGAVFERVLGGSAAIVSSPEGQALESMMGAPAASTCGCATWSFNDRADLAAQASMRGGQP